MVVHLEKKRQQSQRHDTTVEIKQRHAVGGVFGNKKSNATNDWGIGRKN